MPELTEKEIRKIAREEIIKYILGRHEFLARIDALADRMIQEIKEKEESDFEKLSP